MKIIHTADWHIGQTFFGYDRQAEHIQFLNWLTQIIVDREIDALLIAGDIFDVANPSAAAQKLFFKFLIQAKLASPKLQVVAIAGNHDSASRLEAPTPLLDEIDITVIGSVPQTESREPDFGKLIVPLKNRDGQTECLCLAVPYLRQGDYDTSDNKTYSAGITDFYSKMVAHATMQRSHNEAIVAMGHLSTLGILPNENDEYSPIGSLDCVDADCFGQEITYTALGHIHRSQCVAKRNNVRYAGSPLPLSFAEKDYKHSIQIIELEDGKLINTETLPCNPTVKLISIPPKPETAETVLAALAQLPEATNIGEAPFLEVKIAFTEPDPFFRQSVESAIEGKNVRLTRIVTQYIAGDNNSNGDEIMGLSEMTPTELIKRVYQKKYNNEMPADIGKMFADIVDKVKQEQ